MEMKYIRLGSKTYAYSFAYENEENLLVTLYEDSRKIKSYTVSILYRDVQTGYLIFSLHGRVVKAFVVRQGRDLKVSLGPQFLPFTCTPVNVPFVNTSLYSLVDQGMGETCKKDNDLISPLSGRVSQVFVKPGDSVTSTTPVLVIESMKMENVIYASRDAVIKSVFISIGDLVKQNQRLISFKLSGEVYGAVQADNQF